MNTELHEKDFYEWTMTNVHLLRQGKLSEIDVGNIAEELESTGKSEFREVIQRLLLLLQSASQQQMKSRQEFLS
jgi:hypothetical protein